MREQTPTDKLKDDFRREVIDKLSVARGGKEPQGMEARIHNQQCENFLCEQFNSTVDALSARCTALARVLAQLRDDAMVMDAAYPIIASVLSGEEVANSPVAEGPPWWCATCESWRLTQPCGRDECPTPEL